MEACLPPGYTEGIPLEPLVLLSNLPRDVVGDDRLGSYSAVLSLPQLISFNLLLTARRIGNILCAQPDD